MANLEHKMTVRIPRELHKAAKVKAVQSDVTLSEAVREFLRLWVAGEIELPAHTEEEQPELE